MREIEKETWEGENEREVQYRDRDRVGQNRELQNRPVFRIILKLNTIVP